MLVGLGATKAGWSAELRGFIRDHVAAMSAATVLDAGQLARAGKRRFDVVVIDDVSRVFGPGDIARVVAAGTVVIGLYGTPGGLGRDWLEGLGASRLLPVTVQVGELVGVMAEVGPINAESSEPDARPATTKSTSRNIRQGSLTVFCSVSGGAGSTETVVALAQRWAQQSRVLVVEANPLSAVLGARLGREASWGLGWVLGRVAQGQAALPEGLSPARESGAAIGSFDVICGSPTPGGPAPIDPIRLSSLVDEGLEGYDHVVVEVGPLLASPSPGWGSDRFAAGWAMVSRAQRVVVLAAPDPEAAARLVEWRAAATDAGVAAPAWALFGRVPRRGGFEWSHLVAMLERWTARIPFVGVRRLPEDPVVARARWNGELVWRGPWLAAVERLATELAAAPVTATVPVVAVGRRPVSLAGEVGW